MANFKFFLAKNETAIDEQLMRFIRNLPMHFDPQMLVRNLPAAVALLGLLHEANLKSLLSGKLPNKINLKWLLMTLQKILPEVEKLKTAGLDEIEALQLRNLPQVRSFEGDTTYLQLPVYYQGEWERMDLFFRNHSGKQERLDKNNASIRINLDTRYLGKMSALTDIQNGALTLNLVFQKETVTEFIRSNLDQLHQSLADIGYNVRSVTASTEDPNREPEDSTIHIANYGDNLNLIV